MGNLKWCHGCGKQPRTSGLTYTSPYCKKCAAERAAKWRNENPEKVAGYHVKKNLKRLGLTLEEYNKMREEQEGLCSICKKPDKNRRLSVDHDHVFGYTRGLLCSGCNVGLGNFQDDPELLQAALDYLKEWEV